MAVASVLRSRILQVSHLQADAGVERRAEAVIEPGTEDVLIPVGHVDRRNCSTLRNHEATFVVVAVGTGPSEAL